ncbi:hypothetical protein QQS21_003264 [Conoideocrella luteorostrata]|uniref:DUF7580 domain-containing protein n=1 Tax=Conoideocrella luteorostrata TaxID=1105319 RepID=A0AAJ0FWI8_9HYPO|nr:hypothetical protein QQS21_003264 [Conoideocrella luteorostrata]
MIGRPSHDPRSHRGTAIRVSKRSRDGDAVIEQLSHLDREAKKLRFSPREEPSEGDNLEDPDADFALLMRRHLASLDNALRKNWICVCEKCSGLSVRLLLPLQKKDFKVETCFEVFFGVRSPLATTLQKAKITVKDVHSKRMRSVSEPVPSGPPDFAYICQSITESLDQRNCLHLALEDGTFQRLHPQPKTFASDQMSQTVSLSALFKRQQDLRGSLSALSLKGKRILAVTLATALLPFLETPWLQPSFNHSNIQFFQPLHNGELPDITKPFLAIEHIPIMSARKTDTRASSDVSKHMVHPNASVLALGILLRELHYCTPVKENILLVRQPVPSRSAAYQIMTGGNQAIMNYRFLCFPWLAGPDPIRAAMIASVFFGLDGYVMIIRLKEDVLLWAWVGKGDRVFLHDLGNVLGHLTFIKNGGRLGLAHSCEK